MPVSVQLDHASDLNVIRDSVAAGADAVLADGSSCRSKKTLPWSAKSEPRWTFRAHRRRDQAELGGLAGDEDKAFGSRVNAHPAGLTNPAQVPDFVERTGAQLLAVAVGNAHGHYTGEPNMRGMCRRTLPRARSPAGAPRRVGIPAADLAKATSLRVGKVNFNTELRTASSLRSKRRPPYRANGRYLQGLLGRWNSTAATFAGATLDLLRN